MKTRAQDQGQDPSGVNYDSSANLVFDGERNYSVPTEQGTSENRDSTAAVDAVINYSKIIGSKENASEEDMGKFMDDAKEDVECYEGETA
jgi:hypothetical protein